MKLIDESNTNKEGMKVKNIILDPWLIKYIVVESLDDLEVSTEVEYINAKVPSSETIKYIESGTLVDMVALKSLKDGDKLNLPISFSLDSVIYDETIRRQILIELKHGISENLASVLRYLHVLQVGNLGWQTEKGRQDILNRIESQLKIMKQSSKGCRVKIVTNRGFLGCVITVIGYFIIFESIVLKDLDKLKNIVERNEQREFNRNKQKNTRYRIINQNDADKIDELFMDIDDILWPWDIGIETSWRAVIDMFDKNTSKLAENLDGKSKKLVAKMIYVVNLESSIEKQQQLLDVMLLTLFLNTVERYSELIKSLK